MAGQIPACISEFTKDFQHFRRLQRGDFFRVKIIKNLTRIDIKYKETKVGVKRLNV